ncbi:DNA binding domain, excisionase family [Meiothermus luteus]|uniref:DNA binding domain, excisionase family n=1 Tax=Meiothermus luteus TaxID=2026184 RepID=A0A399EIK7_9DEIN|nr:helix-turn-helix domain-containing protein [Meiothermus luteus]RIH83496.1 DNA binding domain, excisionase family [Meiothermus luteus]
MHKIAYGPKELASLLGVHPNTVFRLIRRGELRAVKLGHRTVIPRAELERLGLLPDGSEHPAGAGGGR